MSHKLSKEHGRQSFGRTRTGRNFPRSWFVWGGAALAVVSILIVIAASQSGSSGDGTSSLPADHRIAAPDFQLTLYQGADVLGLEELKFSDIFGQGKPVVLNFWAGLCPPCRAEMPGFQKVYDELGDQFILLGVDIGPFIGLGSREDGQALLRELNITYPAGTTFEAGTVEQYKVRGMPTTVFLTSEGGIFDTHAGLLDEETFRNKVQNLIQASGGS
ncbi:MAG: TlpA disulfide reductase family protein [Chloroflexota bacterium]